MSAGALLVALFVTMSSAIFLWTAGAPAQAATSAGGVSSFTSGSGASTFTGGAGVGPFTSGQGPGSAISHTGAFGESAENFGPGAGTISPGVGALSFGPAGGIRSSGRGTSGGARGAGPAAPGGRGRSAGRSSFHARSLEQVEEANATLPTHTYGVTSLRARGVSPDSSYWDCTAYYTPLECKRHMNR